MDYYSLIGIPFVKGGRSLAEDKGYDCYGLLIHIFKEKGIEIPNFISPITHAEMDTLAKIQSRQKEWVKKWDKKDGELSLNIPEVGDVLWISIAGNHCHVGYCISQDRFIHSWEKTGGAVLERIAPWKNRIIGIYKYNEK